MSFFMMLELSDAVGISTVEAPASATFAVGDNEFGSFSDCKTIDELATLIFAVKRRLD